MAGLEVGAASVDITPANPRGMFLAGFGLGRRAVGVLEPIEAGALHLRQGDQEVTLVSVDVIGLTGLAIDRIRRQLATGTTAESVIVCSTHTHSAPDTLGMWGPGLLGVFPRRSGVDRAWFDDLIAKLAALVEAARAAARPATLHSADVDVDRAWTRNDRKAGGRYDHAAALAANDAATGERIATLLNFASHPETLWDRNKHISPDFVGPYRRHARAHTPGEHLYFSGPLGGMLTPNVPKASGEAERRAYIEALGEHLAERTAAALAAAPTRDPQAPPATLHHARREVRLSNANWKFKLLSRLGLVPARVEGDSVVTEIHHLRVGDLELLTAPGEVLPELGHRVRARMEAPQRMLLCLGCDELGYILEPEMFDEREYRYECSMSVGRPTAEALLEGYEELLAERPPSPGSERSAA